jgi:aminoglycoside phosphotransferase (APT) family kinase protein
MAEGRVHPSEGLTETIPVRAAHRFDEARLAAYLGEHLDGFGGALEVLQMQAGQSNPTFLLGAGGREWVLRKQPPGKLLPSAHAVDREFRIQQALAATDVPVARMLHFCADADVLGTPFYVMERMRGRVFHDNTLPGLTPGERGAVYEAACDILARLHRVDWRALGLADFGKPGNYFIRQIGRWSKQWQASKQSEIPAMERLIAWLPEHVPDDDTVTVVHGDYRLGNMMFHPDRPEVIAVFDWELSTLGHPLSDLAYTLMPYNTRDAFGALMDLDLAALGIPDQESYIRAYCARTGRASFDPTFYLAFSMFRMAAITEGVLARALSGIASSADAAKVGANTRPYAERGWALVEATGGD